jgi:hypothetical protein
MYMKKYMKSIRIANLMDYKKKRAILVTGCGGP